MSSVRYASPNALHRIGGIGSNTNSAFFPRGPHSIGGNGQTTPHRNGGNLTKQGKILTEGDVELLLSKAVKTNRLDLSYSNLSSTDLIHFINDGILRHVHHWNLVEINFASSQLTTAGFDLLVPVLCSIPTLEIVIFRNNHLNKDAGFSLSKLLVNVGCLKLLDVSGNHLGDIGISGFAGAFNEPITSHSEELSLFSIQFLDLSNNGFSDAGILALCRGLLQFVRRSQGIGRGVALKVLKLSSSKLSDKGIQCIAQLINSNKPIVKQGVESKFFQLEELSLENCSDVTSHGLGVLFGDPKNISYSPLKKLNLSLNKSLSIDLLRHLSFCIQYGSCRLEILHLEFSQDRAKECIRQSAKIFGGLVSTEEYSLSEACRELVDTLLNINHTRDVVLKRIFLGALPKSIFELCVEGMEKSDVNLYNDCFKALEYMNPAADIFQIPYITNISSWIRSKMYSNMLFIATPSAYSVRESETPRMKNNIQTLTHEFQSQNLQQLFLTEKEKINESMLNTSIEKGVNLTPMRNPPENLSHHQSMGSLKFSDLNVNDSISTPALSSARTTYYSSRQPAPSSPLFIPGMDISAAFPQTAEYLKIKLPHYNSVVDKQILKQQLISDKYLSSGNPSTGNSDQKPIFASDKSLDFTILELREQEILRSRKDHSDALTALSQEIVKLVDDSPTKLFDQIDKLKSELVESKKIESEVKKLQESIPISVLNIDDEGDEISDETKAAMAALNRKIASGKTESQPLANSVYLVKPIKSKAVKVEPPVARSEDLNTTLLLQDPPDIMRVSSPIQLRTVPSTMGPMSPRSRSTSPNSVRIAQAMIHNSVESSINNLHNHSQNRSPSPLRLFSPSRNHPVMSSKDTTELSRKDDVTENSMPPHLSSSIVSNEFKAHEKSIDQLFDLMNKIFGEVQQIERKQTEIETSVSQSINKFDERIQYLEVPSVNLRSAALGAGESHSTDKAMPNKENVKSILGDRLLSHLSNNTGGKFEMNAQKASVVNDITYLSHPNNESQSPSPDSTIRTNDKSNREDDTDGASVASLYSLPRFSIYDPNFNSKYEEDKQYFQELQSNLAYLASAPSSPLASHFGTKLKSNGYEKTDDDVSQSDISILSSTTRSTTLSRSLSRSKCKSEEKKLPHLPIAQLPNVSNGQKPTLRSSSEKIKQGAALSSARTSRSSNLDPTESENHGKDEKAQSVRPKSSSTGVLIMNHPKHGYMLPTASAWHKQRNAPATKRK